ncbi:MAG: nucleotidyltransferase domain-containing protein [Candidatus Woesearchaeota archaeon]
MDIYQLKWTRLQSEIFRFLCIRSGQKINMRGLAKALKVSPTAVSKSIIELEKESMITIEKSETMNLMSIGLNRDNPSVIDMKRIENLKLLYESGMVSLLKDTFEGCATILFGSYSRGEDTVTSDIDIAVIGSKGKKIDLERWERLLERKVVINHYSSWKEIHKHLKDNILNGVVLSGVVDL